MSYHFTDFCKQHGGGADSSRCLRCLSRFDIGDFTEVVNMQTLTLVLYIAGSCCFLAGSVLSLAQHLADR